MSDNEFKTTDINTNKVYDEPSVFQPKNLLRESRRQNKISIGEVPKVCILDPDGNIIRTVKHNVEPGLNRVY